MCSDDVFGERYGLLDLAASLSCADVTEPAPAARDRGALNLSSAACLLALYLLQVGDSVMRADFTITPTGARPPLLCDGDPCLTSSDCTIGGHSRYCFGGACYLGNESDPCVSSSECAAGLTCTAGLCRRR